MKDIVGFEFYGITTQGRIWSKPRTMTVVSNGRTYERVVGNRWMKPQLNKSLGYLFVNLVVEPGYQRICSVHMLMAKTYLVQPSPKHEVNHINGLRTDNRLENLEYVTRTENSLHKHRVLNHQNGENHVNATITNHIARSIREEYVPVRGDCARLARKYNTTVEIVYGIITNHTWKTI